MSSLRVVLPAHHASSGRHRRSTPLVVRAEQALLRYRALFQQLEPTELPLGLTLSLGDYYAETSAGRRLALDDWLEAELADGSPRPTAESRAAPREAILGRARDRLQAERGPSLTWLAALHRELLDEALVNGALLKQVPITCEPAESGNRGLPLPEELAALDAMLSCRSEPPGLSWLGETLGQLAFLRPFRSGLARLEGAAIGLLLEWLGLGFFPPWALFARRARNPEVHPREVQRLAASGDRSAFAQYALLEIALAAEEHYRVMLALERARRLEQERLLAMAAATLPVFRLHALLARYPMVSCSSVTRCLGVTKPTANRAIETLCDVQILVERTGKQRDRLYARQSAIQALEGSTLAVERSSA